MPVSRRAILWTHPLVSLLLLAANLGAPFNTADQGRVFLGGLAHAAPAQPIVRVRSVSPCGMTQGYRAVVGLVKGGAAGPASRPPAAWRQLPPPADAIAARPAVVATSIPRMSPPLRC